MDIKKRALIAGRLISLVGGSQTSINQYARFRHTEAFTPNHNNFSGVAKAKRAARKRKNQLRSKKQ